MRVALFSVVVLVVLGAGGFVAWKRLEAQPKGPPPGPAFLVTAPASGRVAETEQRVAMPLEEALAKVPGVTRLRTRTSAAGVAIEVWARPGTGVTAPGATVSRLDLPPDGRWIVKSEKRPEGIGAVCGREEPLPVVKLDPLRLLPLRLDALQVSRGLRPAAGIEALADEEVAPQVKLRDVATVELAPRPPRCLAFSPPDEPAFLVTTAKGEVEGGTKLGAATKLSARAHRVPKLTAVVPAVVTHELPSRVTLWFSPPLDATQRAKVMAELAQQPSVVVRHVDGPRRVRLVLTGQDRELLRAIAGTVASTLKSVKGVELVVEPLEPEPYITVKVDRERAAALDIAPADVEALVALARNGDEHDGLRVTVPLSEPEHLGALSLHDHRLAELVMMTAETEPDELLRENRLPAVEIVAYGIDKKAVPMPALPAGVQLEIHEEL